LAWMLYQPWQGVAIHAGAVGLGAILGFLTARTRVTRYRDSIRGTWTQWMRYAVAAESVAEVHRKVRGRSGRNLPILYAALLFVVWASEIGLLVLALVQQNANLAAATVPVIAANGILAGWIVAHNVVLRAWFGEFASSVTELVESGEVNV